MGVHCSESASVSLVVGSNLLHKIVPMDHIQCWYFLVYKQQDFKILGFLWSFEAAQAGDLNQELENTGCAHDFSLSEFIILQK